MTAATIGSDPFCSIPVCSIIVSCFNKAAFIAASLDSALAQTYPHTEVIVVDDGSTDASPAVLAGYETRARIISKANGGQASAVNAGFAVSRGDIIVFLDGDDLLDRDAIERVVAAWRPELSKVHFRMRVVREDGSVVDGAFMPPYDALASGDLTAMLHRFSLYPSPPMSGNAFARRLVQNVLPLPEAPFRVAADTPLIGVAPLFGQIGRLEGPAGSYRRTASGASQSGIDKLAYRVASDDAYIAIAKRISERELTPRWPQHLKEKLIVTKFSGSSGLPGIFVAYLATIWQWPEYSLRQRVMFTVWAVVMLIVPAGLLRRIPGVAGGNVVFK